MDSNETMGNHPSSLTDSADSVSEGKFSFRDLMKAAEGKSNPVSLPRDISGEPSPAALEEGGEPSGDQIIYELTEIIEEAPSKSITVSEFNTEIMKKVSEIAERVAREMFPEIAEKIIREEIAKLKEADK